MPAYVSLDVPSFIATPVEIIIANLHQKYASDGFSTQYTAQTKAWAESIPLLKYELSEAAERFQNSKNWRVLLEFPLYRLRRRIDVVLLTAQVVIVIELKVGESKFQALDRRQVEEYALDLRDFHAPSVGLPIVPILWCTSAETTHLQTNFETHGVSVVKDIGSNGLNVLLTELARSFSGAKLPIMESWEYGAYKPVPAVINAATTLFSGHGVREIAQADASNLDESAGRIIQILETTKQDNSRAIVFLAGVPGSGKTLAGLQIVHKAIEDGVEGAGDIVYLSGNTPLVIVLREALARDDYAREKSKGIKTRIADVRNAVRARIQHIIDFLREYLSEGNSSIPHEHVIVFDEAQRAWNEEQGRKKFGRSASEPKLLLEIMSRHPDWSMIVGLIGGGQEINTGENGIAEWGDALRSLSDELLNQWIIYGPVGILGGIEATANLGLGNFPANVRIVTDDKLELNVPLRSFRSPKVSDWVALVLLGDDSGARQLAVELEEFPLLITRSLSNTRSWLREVTRGERRNGLVASSGARRLRADGLGVTLNATEGDVIAQWYLNEPGDVRSSFALEVTANEYTTQGLELDFVGLCWGGDLLRTDSAWNYQQFRGHRWTNVNSERIRFIENSYRVLLTRAREGLIIWVPEGSRNDNTRDPKSLDETAEFLISCGCRQLKDNCT